MKLEYDITLKERAQHEAMFSDYDRKLDQLLDERDLPEQDVYDSWKRHRLFVNGRKHDWGRHREYRDQIMADFFDPRTKLDREALVEKYCSEVSWKS